MVLGHLCDLNVLISILGRITPLLLGPPADYLRCIYNLPVKDKHVKLLLKADFYMMSLKSNQIVSNLLDYFMSCAQNNYNFQFSLHPTETEIENDPGDNMQFSLK